MLDARFDQRRKQFRDEKAPRDRKTLMLGLSRLGRLWEDQAGTRDRGGRTSLGSDQRVGDTYSEAVSEASQLCVGASLGRAVEQDL